MAVKLKATKPPQGMPGELVLLGQKWTVKYTKGMLKDKGGLLLGLCEPAQHLIVISMKQSLEGMKLTLWHEMVHAYVSMFPNVPSLKEKEEESLADNVSIAILDALRNNKQFW